MTAPSAQATVFENFANFSSLVAGMAVEVHGSTELGRRDSSPHALNCSAQVAVHRCAADRPHQCRSSTLTRGHGPAEQSVHNCLSTWTASTVTHPEQWRQRLIGRLISASARCPSARGVSVSMRSIASGASTFWWPAACKWKQHSERQRSMCRCVSVASSVRWAAAWQFFNRSRQRGCQPGAIQQRQRCLTWPLANKCACRRQYRQHGRHPEGHQGAIRQHGNSDLKSRGLGHHQRLLSAAASFRIRNTVIDASAASVAVCRAAARLCSAMTCFVKVEGVRWPATSSRPAS